MKTKQTYYFWVNNGEKYVIVDEVICSVPKRTNIYKYIKDSFDKGSIPEFGYTYNKENVPQG
jgi:hypothetical protein